MTPESILKAAADYDEATMKAAKLASTHNIELEKLRNQNRDDRRMFVLIVLGGLAAIILLSFLVVACMNDTEKERQYDERMGTICVQSGKEWDADYDECKKD